MKINALGACRAECPWCAKDFWKWYKNRANSGNPLMVAAVTSVKANYAKTLV